MNRGKRAEMNPVDDACNMKDSWYKFCNNSHARIIKDRFENMRIIGVDIAKPKRNIFKRLFDKWNIIDYCPKCGCKETKSIVKDRIDHIICEEETRCAKCDYLIDFWVYGHSASINKRTEQLRFIWGSTMNLAESNKRKGKIDVFKLIKGIVYNIKISLYYIFNADILFI